ncbi:fibronectin type III domain-containing protein [Pyxidicoccus xibeiensis]|uniref:fibronectin type III domain-containing protein n=1 Tax=Pyxidicoccus xibeiensis TaxID=2906759 RepID=UPI0020A827E2|nr:fibronectin type III domain-containing protein [Pyxidicoccus xibeiensis]MCP3144830.1 fibronectin type III domain-containing protein [Pyxidicoccus xibeiensis]
MKQRLGVYALSLLAIVGAFGCGGETEEPPGNRVPVVFDAPDAPQRLALVPGDAQVTASWQAPAHNGGRSILSYTLRALQGGQVVKTETLTALGTTVTGLTNGAEYVFTVAATNEVGEGPQSEPSAPVRPRAIPGAPREVTATPANRSATVSWTAPLDTGMPITGYTVRALSGETVVATESVTGTTATLTGLTNGTSYMVTVTANNAVVSGPASAPVAVTPRTVPGVPTVTLEVGDATIRVVWTLADDGGSPVDQFIIRRYVGETLVRTSFGVPEGFSLIVNGLTNGETYSFTVTARNAVGTGPTSERVSGTPQPQPEP